MEFLQITPSVLQEDNDETIISFPASFMSCREPINQSFFEIVDSSV